MQVNSKEQSTGVTSPHGSEIKKRADGEWGTLPANAVSRSELQPLVDSPSGAYQPNIMAQQNLQASVNSH